MTTEAEATAVFNMVDGYFQENPDAYNTSYANDGGLAAYFWAGGGDFLGKVNGSGPMARNLPIPIPTGVQVMILIREHRIMMVAIRTHWP